MTPSENNANVDFENLKIAVAHWHVNAWGGAEYLVTKLAEAVGVDDVYTLGDPDPKDSNPYGEANFKDITQTLDYITIRRLQRRAGRLFEYAQWEDVDWRDIGDPDVLITSGATTRAVITPDDTLHINYCHSPPRWYYDLYHDRKASILGVLARPAVRYLRMRDMTVDPRVDQYLVNSPIVKRRLWTYYKRDGTVLYPPVEIDRYRDNGDRGFYLHIGRLDQEKGIAAIVNAFESLDEQLVMAGGIGTISDSVLTRIKQAENIAWRGFVGEDEKLELLSQCTAVVFNGRNEDFGIVPVEANASGKPVIARNEGFPGLFVTDGDNGILHDGTEQSIKQAVIRMEQSDLSVSPGTHVSAFSFASFSAQIQHITETAYRDFQKRIRQ